MYPNVIFFFKQKTAYEMRISDWSSDVCSSDLAGGGEVGRDQYRARGAAIGRLHVHGNVQPGSGRPARGGHNDPVMTESLWVRWIPRTPREQRMSGIMIRLIAVVLIWRAEVWP